MSRRRIITRRQMLHGVGGFTLGLPFLPSLLPRTASAQEATFRPATRFFAMATNHGALREEDMFPKGANEESMTLYSGHDVRRADLVRNVSGGQASVSGILSAPESELSESLVSKMNVMRGLDIPFYIAHHTGGHLGNYARNDGNGGDGKAIQGMTMPTIDQVLAWSDKFYSNLGGVTQRSLHGGSGQLSYNFSNPQAKNGNIQAVPAAHSATQLFDQVFPEPISSGDQGEVSQRTPVVDRVFEAYKRLRESNRRMSSADRQRLEDHMARLSELERRITTKPAASCQSPSRPNGFSSQFERYEQMADVIAAAFICGSSRIAVLGVTESALTGFAGDWHQDIAHQFQNDGPQRQLQDANRAAFREVFLQLAVRLDVEEAPGQTVLDNSLLTWSQESGTVTHEARSLPVVTFGSAGGTMRTGQVVDYRNLSEQGMRYAYGSPQGNSGLTYNQYLATCMRAMGLSPSDWRHVPHIGAAGYGVTKVDGSYSPTHVRGVMENADDFLPFLAA